MTQPLAKKLCLHSPIFKMTLKGYRLQSPRGGRTPLSVTYTPPLGLRRRWPNRYF